MNAPSASTQRIAAGLILAAMFVLGVLVGVLADRAWLQQSVALAAEQDKDRREGFSDKIARKLELDAEQREVFDRLMREYRPRFKELYRSIGPAMLSLSEQFNDELREHLREDQIETLDAMEAKMRGYVERQGSEEEAGEQAAEPADGSE